MDKCSCGSANTFHNFEGFECLDCGKYTLDSWVEEEMEQLRAIRDDKG